MTVDPKRVPRVPGQPGKAKTAARTGSTGLAAGGGGYAGLEWLQNRWYNPDPEKFNEGLAGTRWLYDNLDVIGPYDLVAMAAAVAVLGAMIVRRVRQAITDTPEG